jgi:phosphate transport system substrate-binding protein
VSTSRISAAILAVAAALGIAACGSSSSSSSSSSSAPAPAASGSSSSSSGGSATLNGAGSTLAAPIYQQWGSTLKSQGLTINFNPVGSGAGIADLQTATVDFAGSDPALKPTDLTKMKGPVVQFPVAFGAITVSYNLSGVKSGLKLDGPTVANIFLGKIKTWSDPAIKTLNPGISLPSTAITIVHR